VLEAERVEEDDFVDPVDELRPEVLPSASVTWRRMPFRQRSPRVLRR
jgi:hypothetical protein